MQEGWLRHQEKEPVPKRRRRGGRSQVPFLECVLKEYASATTPSALFSERDLFSYGAATPPREEGNTLFHIGGS